MATSTKDPVPEAVRKAEGDALRRLFEQAKMSQPQVAERSGVGSKAFVSQLLTGHRPLNIEQATKIAEVIGRKIDEFSPRLANQIRAAAALVDMFVLTGDTVAVPVTKSTIAIDRTGIHHTPEIENKIVVMNGRLLRFRTVVHTSSSTRVTTMAVNSVVITPMAMVSANPFTSVAATL